MKKLGILGGMGPLAGAYFFLRFSQLTAAQRDDGHPEVVLYSASGIPDRTAWLTGRGESPLPALLLSPVAAPPVPAGGSMPRCTATSPRP